MDVDALNVRAILMSTETTEEDKIIALAQILECIDAGHPFPQLITDALIAVFVYDEQSNRIVRN